MTNTFDFSVQKWSISLHVPGRILPPSLKFLQVASILDLRAHMWWTVRWHTLQC